MTISIHIHITYNVFDTDISMCINIYIKVVYLAFFGIVMLLKIIGIPGTSKLPIVYINDFKHDLYVPFGVGLKCPRKIHFDTQWGDSI